MGELIRKERDPAAIKYPMALDLFSDSRNSPIIELAIGEINPIPSPCNEYTRNKALSDGAKPLPNPTIIIIKLPVIIRCFDWNLTLITPINNAAITPRTAATDRI